MPLTEEEKDKCRYHMGYPCQGEIPAYFANIPFNPQVLYLLEQRMTRLKESTLGMVQDHLGKLDAINAQIHCAALEHLQGQVEDIKPNQNYTTDLRREYRYWQQRLAQILCVPVNQDFSGINAVDRGPRNVRMG